MGAKRKGHTALWASHSLLFALVCVAVLWLGSGAHDAGLLVSFVAIWFAGLLGLFWLSFAAFELASRQKGEGLTPRRFPRWLGVAPALGVLTALLLAFSIPANIRFELSQGDLVAAGKRVLAGSAPGSAGLFRLVRTQPDGGCALLITGQPFLNEVGFAYCPDPASLPSDVTLTRRHGPLYDLLID